MKKIIAILCVLCTSTLVMAAELNTTKTPESWVCYGTGSINMGGPVGSISMTVVGRGDSEFTAMSDAQSRCTSQGLSMCMVNNCFKK
jgi:hypothetical protein